MSGGALHAVLEQAFGACAAKDAFGRWLLLLPPRSIGPVVIGAAPGWIDLSLAVQRRGLPPLEALQARSSAPSTVKLATSGMLRADVPRLESGPWLTSQLQLCLRQLAAAAGEATPASCACLDEALDPDAVTTALHSAGWPASVLPDGRCRTTVAARGRPREIVFSPVDTGWRVGVSLGSARLAPADPRLRAAAALMVEAGSALRWACPTLRSNGQGRYSLGFECLVAAPADAQALLIAADTLIAACELFGREAEVLLESCEVATWYLRTRGPTDADPECPPGPPNAAPGAAPRMAAAAAMCPP